MTNTPIRTVRIEDALWRPALNKARREGRTLTDVIRQALAAYIGRKHEEE